MTEEKSERICWNCGCFFPATMEKDTEFGICLNDEAFEPFIDELLENSNYGCCQDLVDRKKYKGDREACEDYEESEGIEIDDDSPLGRELRRLIQAGELTPETFEQALLEEQIRNIDWTTMPVDEYEAKLKDPAPDKRHEAISTLHAMISLGNKQAILTLVNFLRGLPLPETIEEVHFKKDILRRLDYPETRKVLIPYLIDELYRIPSNNTTRQWISEILRFLEYSPIELVHDPLERMIRDKRFSYKLKQKMKDILAQ